MIRPADSSAIDELWRERWGLPVVTARKNYQPADVQGLVEESAATGLVTFACQNGVGEVVTLDALEPGRGVGTRLLAAAEDRLKELGARRASVSTTNDNLRALGFYQKRGYRLVRIHRDAVDEVRALKPQVPQAGENGIPLKDILELEKPLAEDAGREPHHVLTILAVQDLPRMVRFYRDGFGWPTRAEVPVYVELALPDGRGVGLYLASAFSANTGAPPAPPPAHGTTAAELYFYVDDPDAWARRVESAGGRLLSAAAPRPWGDRVAYLADPEGNVLALARPHG